MSAWKNKYINPNKFSRPQQKLKSVKKLVIHWTANYGASAENHYKYFNNLNGRYASAHIFVDKKEALCIIPLDEVAYHANDGNIKKIPELRPNANLLTIGVEMCVEKDGSFHKDMLDKTVDVFVELCKRYNLNPLKDIVRHFDISGKSCPAPWVSNPNEFESFKQKVNDKLNNKEVLNKNTTDKKVNDLEFTSSTLKANLETRLDSKATAQLIDELAQKELGYKSKLKDGKLTDGDLLALSVELAVACAKNHNQ